MKTKLANLIETRKLIALLMAVTFVALAMTGGLDPTYTYATISMVLGYYFGKSTALDSPKDRERQDDDRN